MFSEYLKHMIQDGITELQADEDLLQEILAVVRHSRVRLQEAGASISTETQSEDTFTNTDISEDALHTDWGMAASTEPLGLPSDFDGHTRLQSALQDADVTGSAAIIDMVKVCAGANRGLVQTREIAQVLISLNLSQSSMEYLPGYIGRKIRESQEFDPVGKAGSGQYRLRTFQEDTYAVLRSPIVGAGPGPLEASEHQVYHDAPIFLGAGDDTET